MSAASPAIECRELVVRYGPLTAVDGLTLTAGRGEVVALLGPNGAGKTSTVENLEGYRRPSAGTVRVLGLDPRSDHRALVPRIGVMLQKGGVYPMLGPRQVLELFSRYYADPADPGELLDLVSLTPVDRTPWRHLSGGEQQRLSLALSIVGRPEVVFLDEPTAGVDPEGRIDIRQVVGDLRSRGACVLLTTHELAEAERMADRVVVIRRGRLVAEGTPDELVAAVGDGSPLLSFGATPGLDPGALSVVVGAPVVEAEAGRYRAEVAATPVLTAALTAWMAEHGATLTDLRTSRSLEEAYLSVVGGGETPAGTSPGSDGDGDGGGAGAPAGRRRSASRRRRGRP